MQTFLPYASFKQSAEVLDYRRLGKQRVEAKQLLSVLLGLTESKGWVNHPAAKMWKGYEGALASYALEICKEWVKRGYKDTLTAFFIPFAESLPQELPPWFGNAAFHAAHRSNLLRKDPNYYSKNNWSESDDLPYIWPTKE